MRDWCAILIDAGLRDLSASELAAELGATVSQTSAQAKRHGVLLRGAKASFTPRARASRHLRPKDWAAEVAFAAQTRETLNAFCLRVGVCAHQASKHAAAHRHTFPDASSRKRLWWRRELALAEAGRETVTAFCRRTGKSASSAMEWAAKLGHTFTPTKHKARRSASLQAAQ